MEKEEYLEKRDKLFTRWLEAHPDYKINNNSFTIDGIVNAKENFDNWQKQMPKILFLLKEAYDGWNPGNEPIGVDWAGNFTKNIARWRYLLIELFKDKNKSIEYPEIPDIAILNDIAIIEIKKKDEDKSKSYDLEIYNYAKKDSTFIIEEIELINPHIIFCCGTGDALDGIYHNATWSWPPPIVEDKPFTCHKLDNRLIISFCHPSAWGNNEELFNRLKRMIIQGDCFNKFNWF